MEKVIAEFEKNAQETIRVQLREFRGYQLLDIRVFFHPEEGGDMRPSKKGISVSAELVPKIKEAIQAAEDALREKGLLDESAPSKDENG